MVIVGSKFKDKANFMAVAWVSRVNFDPAVYSVAIGQNHLTHDCILENKCFSINIPGKDLVEKTDYVGIVSGKKEDKSGIFTVYYEKNKNIPLIEEAALSMECKLLDYVKLSSNTIFLGEITGAYCKQEFLTNGIPDFKRIDCFILTMPDNIYWGLGENFGSAWSSGFKFKK